MYVCMCACRIMPLIFTFFLQWISKWNTKPHDASYNAGRKYYLSKIQRPLLFFRLSRWWGCRCSWENELLKYFGNGFTDFHFGPNVTTNGEYFNERECVVYWYSIEYPVHLNMWFQMTFPLELNLRNAIAPLHTSSSTLTGGKRSPHSRPKQRKVRNSARWP